MSQPTTVEEVFSMINKASVDNKIKKGNPRVWGRWIDAELAKARNRYPFFSKTTEEDFAQWLMDRRGPEMRPAFHGPKPTAEQFWNAAYDYDPLNSNQQGPTALEKVLTSGQLAPLMLGKLYGHTLLRLLPIMDCLPSTEIPNFVSPFKFAITDSAAVIYPDGHPSAETLSIKSADMLPSQSTSLQPTVPFTIKDSEDDKLRRFATLGWVQENTGGIWRKTGQVLVMDMGDKTFRDRQPWLILASQWPTDGEETSEGTFYYLAGDKVARDDPSVPGVFPGGSNRTPICMITPKNKSASSSKPVLKRFGENFEFETERRGGHRRYRPSAFGPALAKIRDWYWDPIREQEVCYADNGLEYMRYTRETKEYPFPDFWRISVGGDLGYGGEIEEKATLEREPKFIALQQSTQPSSCSDAPQPARRRMLDATADF